MSWLRDLCWVANKAQHLNLQFPTFVTHLEYSLAGERYPADTLQGLSAAGRPLLVRYDLEALASAIEDELKQRSSGRFWR